jgi:hypothetical protein
VLVISTLDTSDKKLSSRYFGDDVYSDFVEDQAGITLGYFYNRTGCGAVREE